MKRSYLYKLVIAYYYVSFNKEKHREDYCLVLVAVDY